ncbi:hypothetical protein [Azoarcus sp. CIB]|uniref:hypothetical protein n=1 Tax=Aromatoleum sp. (strain CIB) TaxID=198107 RepID=UPI000ACBC2D6|nr:hypothetical protein [Azoarcus sp. CIB]
MAESLEDRVAYLEKMVAAQLQLNSTLFKLIFTDNARLGQDVAEVLRQLLVSPNANLSPELAALVRGLRALLVEPVPQEVVEASRHPSSRPVE